MPIRDDGVYFRPSLSELYIACVQALRTHFGTTVDITDANPMKKMIDVGFTLPLDEAHQDLDAVYRAGHIMDATGENLDKLLEPYGVPRLLSEAAHGTVYITMATGLEAGAFPNPFVPTSAITFTDSGGNLFQMDGSGVLPGKLLDGSANTGTQSETLQAAGSTKVLAYPITLTERQPLGHIAIKSTTVSGTPAFTIRLEEDLGGVPSGTLAGASTEITGFIPTSGVLTQSHFPETSPIDAGTYWIRIEITAGEATLEGTAASGTTTVRTLSGASWVDSDLEDLLVMVWGDMAIDVIAAALGYSQNSPARGISGTIFNDGSVVTRWSQNVESFTNLDDMGGGRDSELDQEYRLRFIEELAGAISGTPDGIKNAIEQIADDAVIRENTTDNAGTDDLLSQHAGFADNSETIDAAGTTTKLAFKFTTPRRSHLQYIAAQLDSASAGAKARVRVETDAAGSPSGTLAAFEFDRQLIDMAAGDVDLSFSRANEVPSATVLWVTVEATAGSFVFNGTTTATPTNAVKVFTSGSWVLSSLDQILHAVVGGIPAHGYRAYVAGGTADDIAQAQWDSRSAGIATSGQYDGEATDVGGLPHTLQFDRPTFLPVVVKLTLAKDPDSEVFSATSDDVKDVVVLHVGGVDTKLANRQGLSLGKKLFLDALSSRLIDQNLLPGAYNVPILYLNLKSVIATPGALTSADINDLTPQSHEKFIIESVDDDIEITLSDVVP